MSATINSKIFSDYYNITNINYGEIHFVGKNYPIDQIWYDKDVLKKNYKIIFWDVLTEDYNQDKTPEDCLNNVKKFTRNGSVIVFHDSIKAAERLRYFLSAAIQHLKQQGYAFGLIDEK
jgi:peptidoglycan/xylan/chitin deacetylase (PgdA/CDA1 family)